MVLERVGGENALWSRDRKKENQFSYRGEKMMKSGEVEKISSPSDNVLVELRRKAKVEREDGLVGDNYLVIPDLDVYAVFDGVSLSSSDATSSYGASKLLEKKLRQYSSVEINNLSFEDIHDLLLQIVKDLQKSLLEVNKKNTKEFCTTLSMVKIQKDHCFVVSVGDSPVFLQTDDGIEQITIAHDKMREGKGGDGKRWPSNIDEIENPNLIFDKKELQDKQKNPGILRNNPTSLIGKKEGFVVDFYVRKLEKGTRVLLATDGFVKKNNTLTGDFDDSLSKLADSFVDNFDEDDDATILLLEN